MRLPRRRATFPFALLLAVACSGGEEREVRARLPELARELATAGFAPDLERFGLRTVSPAQAREVLDRIDGQPLDPGFYELMWLLNGVYGEEPEASVEAWRASVVDFLSWTYAAFYDAGRRELVLIDSPAGAAGMTDAGLLHELAHAWQDQRRPLVEYRAEVRGSFDQLRVRQLLVEGQAEAIAMQALFAREGESLRDWDLDTIDEHYTRPGALGSVYDLGRRHVLERERAEPGFLARALDEPPPSSEQVLHLAKLGVDEPAVLAPAEWPEDWPAAEVVRATTLGEHGLFTFLLESGVSERDAWLAAIGWDGDRLQLWRDGSERLLAWRLVFDRELDAEQFEGALPPHPEVGVRRSGRVAAWVRSDDPRRVEAMLARLVALPVPPAEPADAASTASAEARWIDPDGARSR